MSREEKATEGTTVNQQRSIAEAMGKGENSRAPENAHCYGGTSSTSQPDLFKVKAMFKGIRFAQ